MIHRSGSLTFFSTTVSSLRRQLTPSRPTFSRHRPESRSRPRAAPHGRVEIDVRRAAALNLAIEGRRRQIDAGVDAAAAAETLQPQHLRAAGHDRIEIRRPRQEEVRAHHVAEHQQHLADHARLAHPPAEEVRVLLPRPAGRQPQPHVPLLQGDVRGKRIGVSEISAVELATESSLLPAISPDGYDTLC